MVLLTAGGERSVVMRVPVAPFPLPSCSHPERLAPLLEAARCIAGSLPVSSSRKMMGALRLFESALSFFGVESRDVDESVIVALIVLRCAPPENPPPFACRPVLPSTAAADVDMLRRAAREGVAGMEVHLAALCHERVLRLQRSIGGRVSHVRTSKRPFLFASLLSATSAARASACPLVVRDAFALVLGFFFAMRGGEVLSLQGQDVNASDDGCEVLVSFRHVKTRQSLFGLHSPFIVAARAPLLSEWWDVFNRVVGFSVGVPVFHRWTTGTAPRALPLSRDWLSHVVKRVDPLCSPHSLRVGCATEAHAAGVPLSQIQALGRWDSSAALLYVLGSLDATASATARLGEGGLVHGVDGLRVRKSAPHTKWWPASDATRLWSASDDG